MVAYSILVPLHKPPLEFFEAMIASVKNQTYQNWQLCLFDDASGDPDLLDRLESFANTDPRVVFGAAKNNLHISGATNGALSLATGEYVVMLDHDDVLPPSALEAIDKHIKEHRSFDMLCTNSFLWDGKEVVKVIRSAPWNPERMCGFNDFSHLSVYRRCKVEEVGGWRSGLDGSQDWDLALRVAETCSLDRIRHLPEPLYYWRHHAGSVSYGGTTAKPYVVEASRKAVKDAAHRRYNVEPVVEVVPDSSYLRTNWPLLKSCHLILILAENVRIPSAYREILLDRLPASSSIAIQYESGVSNVTEPEWLEKLFKENPSANMALRLGADDLDGLTDSLPRLLGWLSLPDIGFVCPPLIDEQQKVISLGLRLNPWMILQKRAEGMKAEVLSYTPWYGLTHAITSVHLPVFAFRREVVPFAKKVICKNPDLRLAEWCLEAQKQGFRSVLVADVPLEDSSGSSSKLSRLGREGREFLKLNSASGGRLDPWDGDLGLTDKRWTTRLTKLLGAWFSRHPRVSSLLRPIEYLLKRKSGGQNV